MTQASERWKGGYHPLTYSNRKWRDTMRGVLTKSIIDIKSYRKEEPKKIRILIADQDSARTRYCRIRGAILLPYADNITYD